MNSPSNILRTYLGLLLLGTGSVGCAHTRPLAAACSAGAAAYMLADSHLFLDHADADLEQHLRERNEAGVRVASECPSGRDAGPILGASSDNELRVAALVGTLALKAVTTEVADAVLSSYASNRPYFDRYYSISVLESAPAEFVRDRSSEIAKLMLLEGDDTLRRKGLLILPNLTSGDRARVLESFLTCGSPHLRLAAYAYVLTQGDPTASDLRQSLRKRGAWEALAVIDDIESQRH